MGSPPEEMIIDAEMECQLCRFVELPGFLGVHNGLMSSTQRQRIASSSSPAAVAACWAAGYTNRVAAFLHHSLDNDEDERGLETWVRRRNLMPLARAIQMFVNLEKLLAAGFEDPTHASDPCVVH